MPTSTENHGFPNAIPAFRIIASEDETAHTTLVSPDIATCDDCLRELFDPADRRFHYPFINCTNCGPRFTIIRDLPYDRAQTSMDAFPMCPTCAAEYASPLDRRFHAQPDACFACGPHLTWREHEEIRIGTTREESDAIIERCAELLGKGDIVAIKGLGGFHLACRADSDAAVRELRQRKRRSNKPLAVMVRDLGTAEHLTYIDETERTLLTGSIRPIVLLRRRGHGAENTDLRQARMAPSGPVLNPPASTESGSVKLTSAEPAIRSEDEQAGGDMGADAKPRPTPTHNATSDPLEPPLAYAIAFDLPELGIMLPYTPLQHLLLAACAERGIHALVMTSGNVSEEPIETDDDLAWTHLVEGGLADALLGNDRAILTRYDDSVVRVVEGTVQIVRRARGYAPQPLALPVMPDIAQQPLRPPQYEEQDEAIQHPGSRVSCEEPTAPDIASAANGIAPPTTPTTSKPSESTGQSTALGELHQAPSSMQPAPPCILACGPEQKATVTLTREQADGAATCFVSQHIGDLENAETLDAWHAARTHMERLFDLQPTVLACDAHPGYLSSQWAREQARARNLPLIEVQHHHAHIASVIAEAAARGNHNANDPVIGIALDGTGAGATYATPDGTGTRARYELDETIWGGEILVANLRGFRRIAHLCTWPLPGSEASVRDPKRNAYALLATCGLLDHPGSQPLLNRMEQTEQQLIVRMIERHLNSPLTSSMGRLLDAIAALLGVCTQATYEGKPAIQLEAAAHRYRSRLVGCGNPSEASSQSDDSASSQPGLPSRFTSSNTGSAAGPAIPAYGSPYGVDAHSPAAAASTTCSPSTIPLQADGTPSLLDPMPLLTRLLGGIAQGTSPEQLAWEAHRDIARLIIGTTHGIAQETGIRTVALSGGVFMNRLLLTSITDGLERSSLTVLTPHGLPFNDGCIAYGQAAVARAILSKHSCEPYQTL